MDLKDLAYAKQHIHSCDLSPIVERLIQIEKWSKAEALSACDYYRKYLYLIFKYDEQYELPPSKEIDEVWHAHILHTEDYQQFCQTAFGYFLHHQPYHSKNTDLSEQDVEQLFESNTQRLFYEEFGEYIYAIRPLSIKTYSKRALSHLVKLFATTKAVAYMEKSSDSSS